MLYQVDSMEAMNRELRIRCQSVGLPYECGSGGLFNASIALVAEAPGIREVALKQPLIGNSGKLLFDSLRREKLTRNHVYLTNVVKRQLVTTAEQHGRPKAPIGRNELDHWRAILLEELEQLPNLRYVVALGNFALTALTGHDGITNWRGSVLDIEHAGKKWQVLVTFNPASLFHEPRNEIVFRMDLGKLTRVINGQYKRPHLVERINPSYAEAIQYLDHCHTVGIGGSPISCDIETMGAETACVGLAHSNDEGMCINFRDQRENRYSRPDERDIRLRLQRLLSDPKIKLIAQNGHFDASWMWFMDRIRWGPIWIDTMTAHHVLYPTLPHDLGFICAQYTDHPYYKDQGRDWREGAGDIDQFWRYNVKDCCVTRIAALGMLDELRAETGLAEFYFGHVARLAPHLVWMTVCGIKCDEQLKGELDERLGAEVEHKRRTFIEAARLATGEADYECNPLSTRDVGDLLFNRLKLVGRGSSTDDENRKRMLSHPRTSEAARAVVTSLDEFKTAHKFHSTYVSSSIDSDGRFRCAFRQTGVKEAPGRLSSAKTAWGTGMNLQNQPEAAKSMFIADDGWEFSYFDAAQIEARIVAWKAPIPKWIEQFELARLNPGSYDAHCALASEMYGIPYEQVPRSDFDEAGNRTVRYIAKRARHGLNYRMGPDRLATTAGLSIREAEEAYRVYHRTTPEITQWWDRTVDEVRRTKRLHNAFGRRLLLIERLTEDSMESIIAFYPQSTAGDHIASVIYKCHDDPRWPSQARVVLNVHDALIAIHRPWDGVIVRRIMKEHAEECIVINGRPCIVPADLAKSHADADGVHRWSGLKKIKEEGNTTNATT